MNLLRNICFSLSVGFMIGLLGGIIKKGLNRSYTEAQIQKTKKSVDKGAFVLKYVTFTFLILGLIWCVYFLIMGVVMPEQAEYADNMSELIVGVLTVISIIFAFVEFLRRPGGKDE